MKMKRIVLVVLVWFFILPTSCFAKWYHNRINDIAVFDEIPSDLDFSFSSSDMLLGHIAISNDYEYGFYIKFEFHNDGKFMRDSAQGDSSTVTAGIGAEIPATEFRLATAPGSMSNLGRGLTPCDGIYHLTQNAGYDYFIWDPGSMPASATVGYEFYLYATWDSPDAQLQGGYAETVTVTIMLH